MNYNNNSSITSIQNHNKWIIKLHRKIHRKRFERVKSKKIT